MKLYKCIKAFCVDRYDEDAEWMEGKSYYIQKGSLWELPSEEDRWNILGGEIELQKASHNGDYIVITNKLFKENFEEENK